MPPINYWIVKGNPDYPNDQGEERDGDIEGFYSTEKVSTWMTHKRIPAEFKKGDRVFFWSSGKLRAIVALGTVENPKVDSYEGENEFSIRHLSARIFPPKWRINSDEIRQQFARSLPPEEIATALYLKSGVVATIYRVSAKQAAVLVRLLSAKNPQNQSLKSWSAALPEAVVPRPPTASVLALQPVPRVIAPPPPPRAIPVSDAARSQDGRNLPGVFVSYSWDDASHKKWVRELATQLRKDGVNVRLDQWELAPGDDLPTFMESAVRESKYVLIVCTPTYKLKADSRKGGVGFEETIMTGELYSHAPRRKFIPILRGPEWVASSPSWLLGSYRIDLRGDPYSSDEYRDLINTLHGLREPAPPIGRPPTLQF